MPEDRRQKKSLAERSSKHLKLARELAGYCSQEEVGEAAGIKPGTYGSYERGWVLVTSEALIKLRGVLHQTADYLLGFEDPGRLSVHERQLLEYFRGARNAKLRESILEHARLQYELYQTLGPTERSE